jgi:hypothetical protein
MQGGVGTLAQFLNGEHDLAVVDLVEVPVEPIKFADHVIPQRRCNVDMMTADVDLHWQLLIG